MLLGFDHWIVHRNTKYKQDVLPLMVKIDLKKL